MPSHVYHTHRRNPEDYEWANPVVAHVAETAYNRAHAWRQLPGDEPVDRTLVLGDIAQHTSLRSGLAARDAILNHICTCYGRSIDGEDPEVMRYAARELGWPASFFDEYVDGPDAYIRPNRGYPPHHQLDCSCQECHPCTCAQAHCEQCNPDGPPDWCECQICRPPDFDDLQDPDDWEGLPEIPYEIPGRCRFGVEVEFNSPPNRTVNRSTIAAAINRAGIACLDSGYTHEVTRFWKMTTDSSVTGGECVSPIMSGDEASIEQAREVIRQVKANGGVTGRNVGMHIHLDVTTFERDQLKALAYNLRRAEKAFAAFVPEHRYNGTNGCGAQLMDDYEWDNLDSWLDGVYLEDRQRNRENRNRSCPIGRYRAFNFNSLLTYGTVECRLLGHTLNTVKVKTWIRTLQAIVEASRTGFEVPDGDILVWLTEFGLEQEHVDRFREVATRRNKHRDLVAA